MPRFLPLRASLEWLRKAAKQQLESLRAVDPAAQLSDAQLAVAREYGHPSWRALVAHVEQVRDKLRELIPADAVPVEDGPPVAPDDPDLIALLDAIEPGDSARVSELLRRRPVLARAHGPSGQTPLHAAAQCNDARIGVLLLAHGADPQARFGESGHSALSWAGTCNAPDFARALVRLGVRADLFEAAGMGSLADVQAFFDAAGRLTDGASRTGSSRFGPDGARLPCPPSDPVEQISDALGMACRNGHVEVVRYLLDRGPDLSFRGYMGATALHWAHFGGSRECVNLLVAAGADSTIRDHELKCTPRAFGICAPANWGFRSLVERQLAGDPALANYMDGQTSALHEAARAGRDEVVRVLLERGADRSLLDGDGKTALDRAVEFQHAESAAILRNAR